MAFEKSSRYSEAAGVTVVAVLVLMYGLILPGLVAWRLVDRWAAGQEIDRVSALEATYVWSRKGTARALGVIAVVAGVLAVIVGVIAGATGSRLGQYGIVGAIFGPACHLIGVHSLVEAPLAPVRVALAGGKGIGDSLPRSRPTFATWTNLSMLGIAFAFAVSGAMLTAVFDRANQVPALWVVIGLGLTLGFGVPITVFASFSPALKPIGDLAEGTKRVAAGDYSQRLPAVQDDDLGVLAASFNRMQAGLAERQRLQGAFGTYVDPALAARLLEQGDDVFAGERWQVTIMFVDIRDFTPFAEANTAEDTVSRLNALFEIVVPAVVDAGGHVNKFLGDGALVVFGAPNDLADDADAAVSAAALTHRRVAERFGGELRIGIGINTGVVIAGTIGSKSNVIPDRAELQLNIRTYSRQARTTMLDAIRRTVTAECQSSGSPREPGFEVFDQYPLTDNDLPTASRVSDAFTTFFGGRCQTLPMQTASEDFSDIPTALGAPYNYWASAALTLSPSRMPLTLSPPSASTRR